MRTTIKLADDAALAARNLAQRERLSLGEAISELIRRGASAGSGEGARRAAGQVMRGRFALLAARDEFITPQHVRAPTEREGI